MAKNFIGDIQTRYPGFEKFQEKKKKFNGMK